MSEVQDKKDIENKILANMYIYYVLNDSIISDAYYDKLERDARALLPEDSKVQGVGSSLASDYSEEVIALANRWLDQVR